MPAGSVLRYWVDTALECIRRAHGPGAGDQKGPFLSARALGLAMAALHDGNALAFGAKPILPGSAGGVPIGTNPVIAGGAACHEVLSIRYPNQGASLMAAWRTWLELNGLGPAGSSAEAHGRSLGRTIEALGSADATYASPMGYHPTGQPYAHDVSPDEPAQGFAGPRWGDATPLLASRVGGFPPPPGRISASTVMPTAHYGLDFDHVAAKGVQLRSAGTRTLEEEVTGIFWGYDGPVQLGTPPRLYMQVALKVLDALEIANPGGLTVGDELGIVAGVAIAMADAGIDAWHYKYAPTHMMWRPVLGIPKALPGNGTPIPGWLPLGKPDTNGTKVAQTPNFPAYPSGHATFGSAAFQLLRLYLAEKNLATFDAHGVDDVRLDFVSDEYNGRNVDPRTMQPRDLLTVPFESLWAAITANSVSRVYLGVHWQFDGITTCDSGADVFGVPATPARLGKTGGVWLGMQIADQLAPLIGISRTTIDASHGNTGGSASTLAA